MNIFLGIIGPFGIIGLSLVYLALLFYTLKMVFKNENGINMFFWVLLVLFFPFIGSIVYFIKLFSTKAN